jgi:hypothetical protein
MTIAATAGGCVHYARPLIPSARPDVGRAYLYGRFKMEADSHALSIDGYATMGFKLQCEDGQSYTIRFSNVPGVQLIEIAPGSCAMAEVVFSDADGGIRGRRLPPPGWRTPRAFAAGKAYYLGDYEGALTHEWKIVETEWRWELTSEENDYQRSTKDLFATYPGFAGMGTADQSFVSAPPRGRPPKRPAARPSPSPEQVARAAPLIGRTFPTMAACEADCAKGDCVAFRGPDGAAMTCIVYCNADGDCSDGFACNGPVLVGQSGPGRDSADAPLGGICVRGATSTTP